MDSIEKIVEEMRSREDEYDYGTLSSFVAEWTDRIEAQMKEPVAWVEVVDTHEGPYHFHGINLLPTGKHYLFVAPPAPAVPVGLAEYIESRRKTIEASIAAEVLAGNAAKEQAERTALAELDALPDAAPEPTSAVSEKYKSTIAELCDCIEDVMNGKGGWAWEEVIQDARNLLEAAPPAPDGFLEMLDSAFESEIKRVSETEYNSNVICRHFYDQMRARLLDVLAAAPEREQT